MERQAMPSPRNQTLIGLGVFASYCLLILVANWFASLSGGDDTSPYMAISGSLLAFVAIPVFSIAIPLWLARRWQLAYAWWPDSARSWLTAIVWVGAYVFIANFYALQALWSGPFDVTRFSIHFVSAMLFHVPYYPLFAILIFRTSERWLGLPAAIGIAALLFALYHLTQYYFFPTGTQLPWLIALFAIFVADMLLYLITRSLGLVALGHCVGGAVGMASAGTYFPGMDFVFFVTIVIIGALLVWSILDRKRHDGAADESGTVWLRLVPSER